MINGPDGLTGAVMAIESIPGATVLMHGPGGCRVRNSLLSMSLVPREDRRWGEYGEPYYSGYSRVPASYIDGDDYIGGAVRSLEDALAYVRREGHRLVAVVDSPGASLMADNHMAAVRDLGMSDGVLVLEGSTMSAPVRRTYGRTLASVMGHLSPERSRVREGTVCLLGLTVLDASWQDVLDELSAYLGDMGLEVLCAPGAGASLEDLEASAEAELCAVVCRESCEGLSDWYAGMGAKVADPGAPVGFAATRRWILGIAEAAGRDPSAALARLERTAGRVSSKMEGMRYGMMRVRGMTFSASAPSSVLEPLSGWLTSELGMVPAALFDEESGEAGRLARCHVAFCDGNTALRMEAGGRCVTAVSMGYAVIGSDGMVPRPIFGAVGALNVLDAVMRSSRGR